MKQLCFWLLAALLITSCHSAQKTVYAPDQIVPMDKSLLWKISGNGLRKPSYLYGTIHLIPKADLTLSEPLRAALDQSKRITFEIDMKEMTNLGAQLGLMTKAFMAGGKTLRDLLTPEDYAFVKAKMADKGLPAPMLERMKPLFLSTLFTADEGGEEEPSPADMTSVEMELYRLARRARLESAGLETTAYQMSIFDSIPYTAQAKMLVESLRAPSADSGSQLADMIKLYQSQDINALQEEIGDEASGMSGYTDILLKNRNRNWIPVMGRMMREKPTLFAVGAGHLGGSAGVIALLRRAGYRVDPVKG